MFIHFSLFYWKSKSPHPPPTHSKSQLGEALSFIQSKKKGREKFFGQQNFYSRNSLKWQENRSNHFFGTMTPPLVVLGWGRGLNNFLAKNCFFPEMVWNGEKVVKSLFVKDQGSILRPFWDNLFLFFLLFNLRWAQLYVSLVLLIDLLCLHNPFHHNYLNFTYWFQCQQHKEQNQFYWKFCAFIASKNSSNLRIFSV